MSIDDRVYRTCTYIAGDWTGDFNLINKLHEWNESEYLGLSFVDVHELTQSRDTSNPCSIKQNLRKRLNVTKTFVLIVGENTNSLTKGGCRYCSHYFTSYYGSSFCNSGSVIDNRSFIEYECEMALKDYIDNQIKKIVVIYNGRTNPAKEKCPEILRRWGIHIGSIYYDYNGVRRWNYQLIKSAICG